jgi:saccharopine dehydrogenase (NADP+, L-glutamate forming)
MKKVLILGAGMVVKPIVEHLLNKGIHITIATRTKSKADAMIKGHPNGTSMAWTVDDQETLDGLIPEHNLTVSLLPYNYHVMVAKLCLKHKKNMVTTSYVKPEMQSLDTETQNAGIIILNEIGLDPGIDHMSAMRIIDHVHNKGGKIEEFYSITGALPAPEAADNPFKYKFSWSPKGVISAGNNDGRYLKNGKEVYIPTEYLFKDTFTLNFPQIGELEVYPNRDSIDYINIYNIPETKTMYRGTFRYKGWCETIDAMKALHLFTDKKMNLQGKSYAEFLASLIGMSSGESLKTKVAEYLGTDINTHIIKALEWLGLFEEKPLNRKEDTPFEVTSDLMIEKMKLCVMERDMVVMQHIFLVSYPDESKEVIKSRMLDYGTSSTNTSIARTVSMPATIAVLMILENKITIKGVCRPVLPEIYNPVLDELAKMNIKIIDEYGLQESGNIPSW